MVRNLDILKLKNVDILTNATVEKKWSSFRDTVYHTALEALGYVTRSHENRCDEHSNELKSLIKTRNNARIVKLNRGTRSTKIGSRQQNRNVQRRCGELKN